MERSGLRERKKLRTRALLIDAAAELCLKQGYDNTTVDQIAAAADVSPRTFSRYFSTKDAVIMAMSGDMDAFIAEALERQPADITEYEALLRAHVEVFGPEKDHQTPGFKRMAVFIQIVNSSAAIKASAFSYQEGLLPTQPTVHVIGRRMGVAPDDPAVRMVADVWTVLFANSFTGLGQPGNEPIEAKIVCQRLGTAVELFRRSWSPWRAANASNVPGAEGEPPASG